MQASNCYHCGLAIGTAPALYFDEKEFCCQGCQTVYELFHANDMGSYYDLAQTPGATPSRNANKFDFLENASIVEKLLDFKEGESEVVRLYIPHIHCSSCIWILENLHKLQPGVSSSQVNFHEKKVRIHYNSDKVSLRELVDLLCRIGYEPYISLEQYDQKVNETDRSLVYKLGVAFFCFGNIMLLSFPEYFEVDEYWLNEYKGFFRGLMFVLSLPSFLYSASGYYISAWKAIRTKRLNIDIPIALGIIVMFVRSAFDMLFDHGPGFMDSLTALVFFMLLGKMFQSKTYNFLNFERDYKSYFPVAVSRLLPDGSEESVPVYEVQRGDRLLLRNEEVIPTDGILISEKASVDYSFVTGEAVPVSKKSGDKLFAGGKPQGGTLILDALAPVSQSYLTQLWSNEIFQKDNGKAIQTITDKISLYFTPTLLFIAFAGLAYWWNIDKHTAFNVFTAVLIVACPCALALTAPFTLGNILRIYGRAKLYLKNAQVIEAMQRVDAIVLDKTGTITTADAANIEYHGRSLSDADLRGIRSVVRNSNHPLSRMLYQSLGVYNVEAVADYQEPIGKGVSGVYQSKLFRIGSSKWLGQQQIEGVLETAVHIEVAGNYYGKFVFRNQYREGVAELFSQLQPMADLYLLSGDNEGEREFLEQLLPTGVELHFNQKPDQKLNFIQQLQAKGKTVMMIGDGLNDAGALQQANVGIAVAENVNVFSPACDGILDASQMNRLPNFIGLSHSAIRVIKFCFGLSLAYNAVGLTFAVMGLLSPLVATIIMPLSTVTIISCTTLMGNWAARRLKINTVTKENRKKNNGLTNVIFYPATPH